MGQLDFGRPTAHLAPPVAHALHDENIDVVDGDVAEVVHNGLPVKSTIDTGA